ncbi:hypothetical protein BSL78_19495 [Apostichopus japonicus]|uniref:Uncharacterized protein n=1 Tax=Stichopus japonicus TaxID=307972 RepID=A0A2G8K6M4_STIJA|nr:hypothetical protein BSL78_19495 [Apostichopus japonicus]
MESVKEPAPEKEHTGIAESKATELGQRAPRVSMSTRSSITQSPNPKPLKSQVVKSFKPYDTKKDELINQSKLTRNVNKLKNPNEIMKNQRRDGDHETSDNKDIATTSTISSSTLDPHLPANLIKLQNQTSPYIAMKKKLLCAFTSKQTPEAYGYGTRMICVSQASLATLSSPIHPQPPPRPLPTPLVYRRNVF